MISHNHHITDRTYELYARSTAARSLKLLEV